jgi:hypothetical protein
MNEIAFHVEGPSEHSRIGAEHKGTWISWEAVGCRDKDFQYNQVI